MKRLLHIIVIVTMLALTLGVALPVQAATPASIAASIVKGLTWLAGQQQADGRWMFTGGDLQFDLATTGICVLKFEESAHQLGLDPFDAAYPYASNVTNGLAFILKYIYAGNDGHGALPFTNSDYCYNNRVMYTLGICMAAISSSNHPDDATVPAGDPLVGQTYRQVVQAMMNRVVYAQNTEANLRNGGWGYCGALNGNYWADNSVSGYVTIGIGYATAAPPEGFGMTIPASVVTGLDTWTQTVQTGTIYSWDGAAYDGGSIYNPYYAYWENDLKTGNLLYELSLVGVLGTNGRVTRAVAFFNNMWGNEGARDATGAGWLNDIQAMFTMMKGLKAYGITLVGTHNWFDEVSTWLVSNQNADGHWLSPDGELYYSSTFSTAEALLVLEQAVPPAMTLTPATASNPINTSHTVTATYKLGGVPQAGVTINFAIIGGPNVGLTGSAVTDANGHASFTYTGTGGAGTDTIKATAVDEAGNPLFVTQATKEWIQGGPAPSPEVGGNVYPANKFALLAPWIGLAIVLTAAAGTAVLIRRRRVKN